MVKIELDMYVTESGTLDEAGQRVFQVLAIIDFEISHALYSEPLTRVVLGGDFKLPYVGRVASVSTHNIIAALLVVRRYTVLCSWLRTYMDQPTDPSRGQMEG